MIKIKRAWIISDLHFGMRSNSREWLDIQERYFYDWFIPMVNKYKIEGDVLFILGDVFDNRQNTQLYTQHIVIKLMEDLKKLFPEIYILVGNHDIFLKSSNEVTSLDCLKYIPDIKIFKEPELMDIQNKSVLMMPWRKDSEAEGETLDKYGGTDYLFCHSEIFGVKLNNKVRYDKGNNIDLFKKFRKVYSGHIHYSQKIKNFTFVGNPYEMTRSDSGNKKGIYVIDFVNDREIFLENDFSPKFLKVNITSLYEKTVEEVKEMFRDNFIDLYVSSSLISKYEIGKLFSLLDSSARKIDPQIYEEEDNINYDEEAEYETFDLFRLTDTYVKNKGYDESVKKRIIKEMKNLYEELNQER